jgi:poly(A) polymerase
MLGAPIKKYLQVLSEINTDSHNNLYLVGGTVRDTLLGEECSDFDFTAKYIKRTAHQFAADTQSAFVNLDSTPGRETFRVVIEKQFNFDFTEMQGHCIEEDLAQRDFTINAMAIRLNDFLEERDVFIDLHQGRSDLKNKIVRVQQGPIFTSDPCRILRAFRFASTLNFQIDADTLSKIESEKSNLNKTALERIYYEWILFLGGQNVYKLLQVMDQTGVLEYILPEAAKLREVGTGTTNAWQNSMDTFKHLESLLPNPETIIPPNSPLSSLTGKRTALLKFSALLYRLMPSSPGGLAMAREKLDEQSKIVLLLKRLRASNADIQFIFRTILCQQEATDSNLDFAGKDIDESKMYQFVKNNESELMSGIFLACAVKSTFEKEPKSKTEKFYQAAHRVGEFYFERYLPAMEHKTLLDGKDLIQDFKLPPSPLFQIILDRVEEARVLGTIQSRSEAEALAQEIIQLQQVQ